MNEPKSYYIRSLDKEYITMIRAKFFEFELNGRYLIAKNKLIGNERTLYFLDDIPEEIEEIFNIETIDVDNYVFRVVTSLKDSQDWNYLVNSLIVKGRRIGK